MVVPKEKLHDRSPLVYLVAKLRTLFFHKRVYDDLLKVARVSEI
jgi:hypothetical protein